MESIISCKCKKSPNKDLWSVPSINVTCQIKHEQWSRPSKIFKHSIVINSDVEVQLRFLLRLKRMFSEGRLWNVDSYFPPVCVWFVFLTRTMEEMVINGWNGWNEEATCRIEQARTLWLQTHCSNVRVILARLAFTQGWSHFMDRWFIYMFVVMRY